MKKRGAGALTRDNNKKNYKGNFCSSKHTRALTRDSINNNFCSSKHSQITIFIIIAVIIIAGIILFFLLSGEKVSILKPTISNPQSYIQKCAGDSSKEAINIMLSQGGYLSPENYKLYKDNKVEYLCYNKNYYYPCINQEPLYIRHLEQEIKDYISPKIKDCFYNLEQEYRNKNWKVNSQGLNLNVELKPKQVRVDIDKKLELSKGNDKRKYEKIKTVFSSPIYDLGIIAQEIASQEAKFCNFEYLGYSLLYPSYSIEKDQVGSGETISDIYKIKDKTSEKELLIAIRSCAMPGGL